LYVGDFLLFLFSYYKRKIKQYYSRGGNCGDNGKINIPMPYFGKLNEFQRRAEGEKHICGVVNAYKLSVFISGG